MSSAATTTADRGLTPGNPQGVLPYAVTHRLFPGSSQGGSSHGGTNLDKAKELIAEVAIP